MDKTCENCGKFDDCRSSNANWPCYNESAWEPIENDDEVDDLS